MAVNTGEAAIVRRIFEEMLTIGSPTRIAERLASAGITTQAWQTQDGRWHVGIRIDKEYAREIPRNRNYRGKVSL